MKNKKIIFIFLLLISIFTIKNTYALDLKTVGIDPADLTGNYYVGYGNFLTNANFKNSWTESYRFNNLNNKNNIEDYDYLQFGFIIQYNQQETYTEQTNDYSPEEHTESNCIEWEQKNQTYADGTTSSYYVCKKWESTKTSSFYGTSTNGTLNNTPNIAINIDAIFDDRISTACELKNVSYGNNYVTCKIPNDAKVLTQIRFRNTNTLGVTNDWSGRFGIQYVYSVWKDPNSQIQSNTNQIQNNTNEIKNDIKNENTSGAQSSADDLKNNTAFNDNTGLSGIVSMPLTIVNSFSNTCQPISLNFPYFGEFQLPCLQSVISSKIPGVVSILKIVINGFLIYRVMLDIFAIVRSARNPDEDRIEVLDL